MPLHCTSGAASARAGGFGRSLAAGGTDPNFANVSLLLHFDGSFIDSSTNGLTATVNGGAAISTSTPLFGSGCLNQVTWSTDYISYGANAAFGYGTGNFTWDISFKITTLNNSYLLCHAGNEGVIAFTSGGRLYYYNTTIGGSSVLVTSGFGATSTFNDGNWHRLRASRVSGVTYLFADGTLVVSAADTHNYGTTNSLSVGSYIAGGNNSLQGKIDEVRITKGVGRSTASYTLETAEFPLGSGDPYFANVVYVSNMQGTNGGTAFTDNSLLANAMTAVGNAQTSTGQFKWGNSSALFDGAGDAVQTGTNIAGFNFNGVAFTFEAWVYRTKNAAYQTIIATGASGVSGGTHLSIGLSNELGFNNGLAGAASGGTVPANAWCFVAASVSASGSIELYLDGTRVGTATQSPVAGNAKLSVGMFLDGAYGLGGNIGAVRITKGTQRYTGTTHVVPTAAFPTS